MRPPANRAEQGGFPALIPLASLIPILYWGAAPAQTSLALSSHWGGISYPQFHRGYQAGVTLLSFTEFDRDGKVYGLAPEDTGAAAKPPYPQTVGFNFFTLAYANHVNSEATELANMMYRYSVSLGLNNDALTEYYQNQIIHRAYAGIKSVPRGEVRCGGGDFGAHCIDYSFNGEVLYRFTNLELQDQLRFSSSNFFSGAGVALGSVDWEGYLQFGIADFHTLIVTDGFGIRVGSMARVGGILQNPIMDNFGSRVFQHLATGYYMVQGDFETTFGENLYPIVLGNYFTYHSGFFVDRHGRSIPQLFWTLSLEIDQLYFETSNDMLGGSDYGPTFGVKVYWDFEGRSKFFKSLERFVKKLNKS